MALSEKHKESLRLGWIKRREKGLGVCWSKGKKLSETHPEAFKKQWETRRKNGTDTSWNKGKKMSAETIEKNRIAQTGKKQSEETRKKRSEAMRGEKNHNYKNGLSKIIVSHYADFQYKLWRESVFIRDNYTCQYCFVRGGYLEAHHIKEWSNYIELRFDLNNGLTLCKECHKKTDNFGGKKLKKEKK